MQEATHAQARAAAPLAEVLRRLRTAAGLSQEELARRAKLSTDAVSALERGTRTRPYPATIRAIADAVSTSPDEYAELLAAVLPPKTADLRETTHVTRPRRNLPVALTPLLGRDADITKAARLFDDSSSRLVTFTGIGGVGKTRLAIAVAERIAPSMVDGAVFVPLAGILEETLLLPEIGRAVDIAGRDSQSTDNIITALTPLRLLLVLDNLEHLSGAAPVIARLLTSCPEVSALVTSRSRLGIRGETEFPVRPLGLPELTANDASSLSGSPAATLLVTRGRAVRPDLQLRPEDVPAIAAICHRVAGIPLALELAAAGLRALDPGTLLSRLDNVLESTPSLVDLPPRQQTMRATLDYSYSFLTDSDKPGFRKLSVFIGGFGLDAAETVVGDADAVNALGRLVAQSLVIASAVDGEMRYELLGPVAEYGRSLLADAEGDVAARAHAAFYLKLAERAAPQFRGSEQVTWFGRVSREDGNLSAALRWAIDNDEGEIAGRMSWALWMYWWMQGRLKTARDVLDGVLRLEPPDWVRARVLVALGAVTDPADPDAASLERRYEEALELAVQGDDPETVAAAEAALGLAALRRQDFPQAERRLSRAHAAALRADEPGLWYADVAQVGIGAARRFQGDPIDAEPHIVAGLESARRRGDQVTTCMALYNLGQTALAQGDHEAAREHLGHAAQLCAATGDAANLSYVLDALATIELELGLAQRAATLLGAAQAMRNDIPVGGHDYYGPDLQLRDKTADRVRHILEKEPFLRAFQKGSRADLASAVELCR